MLRSHLNLILASLYSLPSLSTERTDAKVHKGPSSHLQLHSDVYSLKGIHSPRQNRCSDITNGGIHLLEVNILPRSVSSFQIDTEARKHASTKGISYFSSCESHDPRSQVEQSPPPILNPPPKPADETSHDHESLSASKPAVKQLPGTKERKFLDVTVVTMRVIADCTL